MEVLDSPVVDDVPDSLEPIGISTSVVLCIKVRDFRSFDRTMRISYPVYDDDDDDAFRNSLGSRIYKRMSSGTRTIHFVCSTLVGDAYVKKDINSSDDIRKLMFLWKKIPGDVNLKLTPLTSSIDSYVSVFTDSRFMRTILHVVIIAVLIPNAVELLMDPVHRVERFGVRGLCALCAAAWMFIRLLRWP